MPLFILIRGLLLKTYKLIKMNTYISMQNCEGLLTSAARNLTNMGKCLQVMKLKDILIEELKDNEEISVRGIKNELSKRQSNMGQIIKELKDMMTDNPKWKGISEQTKKQINQF